MAPPDEDASSWSTDTEEFDPTAVEPNVFDPDSTGPEIDVPQAPDPTDNDVSPALRRAFWLIVLMANVGLFAFSIGVMFVVFREQFRLGGSLVLLGVIALLVGYHRYRQHRNR